MTHSYELTMDRHFSANTLAYCRALHNIVTQPALHRLTIYPAHSQAHLSNVEHQPRGCVHTPCIVG